VQAAQPYGDPSQRRTSPLQSYKNVSDATSVDDKVLLLLFIGNAGKIPNQAVVLDHHGSRRFDRRRNVNVDAHLALYSLGTNGLEPGRQSRHRLLRKRHHCQRRNNKKREFHSLDREKSAVRHDRSFLALSPMDGTNSN
jgi:hypothetical protein